MFYSYQLEAVITHAVSQLCYKWLPVPLPSFMQGAEARRDLRSLGIRDWLSYIEDQVNAASAAPWVQQSLREKLSLVGLATVIFDNLREIELSRAEFLDFFHPSYPHLLKHIPDPPAALTTIGRCELFERPKVAIVGSRKASSFAFQESRQLALQVARSGGVVVSGGALGCDAAAHLGALDAGLLPTPTIVVFAGGLHKYYPQTLQSLFGRLSLGGALFVSERLWSYPARPQDFPVRNRIIAGLSSQLALMQAGEKSGALKTATYAIEQGRDVYALVHEKDDVRAEGSWQLIEDGALPFHSASDFLSLNHLF